MFDTRNGPTHGEVKWFKGEPVLVEVGARCHGGDGLWLALEDECFGCNQAKCAIDSYLFPSTYALMPAGVRSIFVVLCHPRISMIEPKLSVDFYSMVW